jgi:hypothetical protein
METMILVAGLAVAGLAGIAAAFYFSLRSGSGYRRGSRRPARAGSSRADGHHASEGAAPAEDWVANDVPVADEPWAVNDHRGMNDHRTADNSGPGNAGRARNAGHAANAGRTRNAGQPAAYASGNYQDEARTGPNTVMDFGQEPGLISEPAPLSSPTPLDAFGPAADLDEETGPSKAAKSRRRMGWRKGSDIDEEMWPAEAFGGLSDDQFWDDLASDKPLTTTARSAHQVPGVPGVPGVKEQLPDAPAAAATARARVNGRRAAHGAETTPGHPDARPRTVAQPLPQAPSVSSASQATAAYPQPTPTHLQPTAAYPQPTAAYAQPAAQLQPTTESLQQAGRPGGPPRQFPAGTSQPGRSTTGPNETRGRRHADASEDPLTSSAFSLRASGPVDGWSNQAPRETGWDQYNAAVSQGTETQGTETQVFNTGDTQMGGGGYQGVPSYRPSPAQHSSGGWPREGSADPYSGNAAAYNGTSAPYSGNSAHLYPGRPSGEQRSYGEDQPYTGNRSRRGATGPVPNAPTQPPNALPSAPYGDAATTEPRRPNGTEARRGTQPPRPGYQGPALPGADQRRPREPQNPRDGYRR